jgi:hypothetical protein
MPEHIGKHQRDILQAVRAGAVLEQEGHGLWSLYWPETGHSQRCYGESAKMLWLRGFFYEARREEHPGYSDGVLVRYGLTEKGKRAA